MAKRNFIDWFRTFRPSIATFSYYADFPKIFSNVDAIKIVSKGIEMFKNDDNGVLIITHNTRILNHLKVDYVHVLVNGQIVKTSTAELAEEIEETGYAQYKK